MHFSYSIQETVSGDKSSSAINTLLSCINWLQNTPITLISYGGTQYYLERLCMLFCLSSSVSGKKCQKKRNYHKQELITTSWHWVTGPGLGGSSTLYRPVRSTQSGGKHGNQPSFKKILTLAKKKVQVSHYHYIIFYFMPIYNTHFQVFWYTLTIKFSSVYRIKFSLHLTNYIPLNITTIQVPRNQSSCPSRTRNQS